jgi:F-type H+-transporting ATPase subunit b
MTFFALILIFAEGDPPWWDYPGFELWKFTNLAIFIVAAFVLHRFLGKPVSNGLQARKELIARALVEARQERDDALRQLAEVESRLAGLSAEVAAIGDRSRSEADAENARIQRATEAELVRLRESAKREIEAAIKSASTELRRFASEESIRLAEQFITSEISSDDDLRITRERAQRIGGARL